jgi:sigma-B regulation protein RsbU (phosphoserine phosphatase)
MGIRMGVGINMKMIYTMKKLNREVNRTTFSTRFVSVFYGELHRSGGLLYANAGHTSGLIITDDTFTPLDPTGPIMGPLPDIPLERGYANVPEGAILALYTDGITERVTPEGTPFEIEGLVEEIRRHRHRSASDIVSEVFEHVATLGHESDMFEDDMTLVILKREQAVPQA